MEDSDLYPLKMSFRRRLDTTSLDFKRSLYSKINWKSRMIAVKGQRGVGKTTLLLQRIKETDPDLENTFWVSLDNLWFKTHGVDDLVEWLYTHGKTTLFFDEVHKCTDWTVRLKNYYDSYPDLRIVYTGSSLLEIEYSDADLSRRQTVYTLPTLSLREYLSLEGIADVPQVKLPDLLCRHEQIARSICKKTKILNAFADFLDHGQYPFYKTDGEDFYAHLAATANLVIQMDMPAVMDVTYATVEKTRKLLMIIAENVPLEPNVNRLSGALSTTRDMCLKMLYALKRAGILALLTRELKNYKQLASPEKIYLADTNLMSALCATPDVGNKRETFFISQLQQITDVTMPQKGDFLLDGKILIEVGGTSKKFDQIKDIPDSYLAIDNIETGFGNRIPLWMFGLLY